MTAPQPGPLAETSTRGAVLDALAAEHAAIWAYGLASAFLPGSAAALTDAAAGHRARRDAVLALLEPAGIAPVPSAAAYRPPAPVGDGPSAARLLVLVEEDVASTWRAVCEQTSAGDGAALRELGLDAVIASARVGVAWRRLAGADPVVPVLPGVPPT